MNGIVNAHKAEFDAEPEVVVEVPQVTTLLGAFADFCKGYSLMSTNTQGLRVAISRRPDQMVIAFNSTSKERKKFQLTGIRAKREDRWASVIKGLCQLLIASGFRLPSGFNLTIKGQSAVADPPALSAALASGLVVAFNELFSFGIEPNNLVRYAYSVNKYTDKYKSRLRDLITIFTAEQGKMMLFDLETCAHKTFDYPFRKGGKTGSWFIDCSLPADELSSEVSLFRENAEAAFSMLRSMLPEKEKIWVTMDSDDWVDVLGSDDTLHYRYKECIDKFPYSYTTDEGNTVTVNLTEKRVLTWSPKLAEKKAYEIRKMAEKACGEEGIRDKEDGGEGKGALLFRGEEIRVRGLWEIHRLPCSRGWEEGRGIHQPGCHR